jgi:hypothetical protein
MRAVYSIYFPVTGCTTALAWCCCDQWLFTKVIAILAVSVSQKLFCDKFLGERFCERICTLGGEGRLVIGVTTLGSNDALVVSLVLIIVCDLVWRCWCTGEAKIGRDKLEGIVCSAAMAGTFGSP